MLDAEICNEIREKLRLDNAIRACEIHSINMSMKGTSSLKSFLAVKSCKTGCHILQDKGKTTLVNLLAGKKNKGVQIRSGVHKEEITIKKRKPSGSFPVSFTVVVISFY